LKKQRNVIADATNFAAAEEHVTVGGLVKTRGK